MSVKVGFISLGCSKNLVDTELMLGLLEEAGYQITGSSGDAGVMVINTCGFITPAKEEAISAILETARLKEKGSLKALLVTGCLAQRYGAELMADIPEIDGILGTGQIGQVVPVLEKALAGQRPQALGRPEYRFDSAAPRLLTTPGHWAYVKIADGCSNRCSYCAIPGIRGNYRSRTMEDLEAEVSGLVRRGVKEIILVAQDTTAYGQDIYGRPGLAGLLQRLAATGAPWIRVMYCYPTGFTPDLIRVMSREEAVCKYIDLPLQHINSAVLKRMNRRGTPEEIRRLTGVLRDSIPGLTLRTTFMVGFPGEGEEEFGELYSFVQESRFEMLGVFKFSPEEGTTAALMADSVAEEIKEYRYHSIMALQKSISLAHNMARVNTCVPVLVDGKKPGRGNLYYGRTPGDAPEIDGGVLFTSAGGATPGEFVNVRVVKGFHYGLRGVRVR